MKPSAIIIHHVGYNHSFYTVNSGHKKKWNFKSSLGFYIGYQYFINNNGKLFKGRSEEEEGAHKKGWNTKSVGICLRGNLETREPTSQQLATLRDLLKDIQERHNIPNKEIYAHRELSATLCPGKHLMTFLDSYRKYVEVDPSTPEAPKTPEKPTEKPTDGTTQPTKGQLQAQLDKIAVWLNKLKKQIYEILNRKRNR